MEIHNISVGILGFGEIGNAIAHFYKDPYFTIPPEDGLDFERRVARELHIQDPVKDLVFPEDVQFDYLHVCIPFTDPEVFNKAVCDVIEKHAKGGLVFIHSTVAPGTTEKIFRWHKHIVHAPVRGVHPHIAQGIETFPMFVGADFSGAGRLAALHLDMLGIEYIVVHKSATSELLKLLDTTYYGVCIAFHAYADKLCTDLGVNFDMVMTEANRSYNEGYTLLGKKNVVRPVLHPPDGPIGGHCVVPNAVILEKVFGEDPLLSAILRHK